MDNCILNVVYIGDIVLSEYCIALVDTSPLPGLLINESNSEAVTHCSGAAVVQQRCSSGAAVVQQWCSSGAAVVQQWCSSDVAVVQQW